MTGVSPAANFPELEEIEIKLLLEGVFACYGFDFRDYAVSSLKRRVRFCIQEHGINTVSALQERVLHDRAWLEHLLAALSIKVTAMFRDPQFYLAFRQEVVPVLRSYPSIRIWHAGCSSGEEAFSMAILLREEGLYEKTRIYATDISEAALERARQGVLPLASMKENTANYLKAGGTGSLAEYYNAGPAAVTLCGALKRNLLFAQHNLAVDSSFNEFHVILCRNVMIYFSARLQARVHRLLHQSLEASGFLGLGIQESLATSLHVADYKELDSRVQLYRRVR